jgi:hypothetical protein
MKQNLVGSIYGRSVSWQSLKLDVNLTKAVNNENEVKVR